MVSELEPALEGPSGNAVVQKLKFAPIVLLLPADDQQIGLRREASSSAENPATAMEIL
jgi:hypothetical protein